MDNIPEHLQTHIDIINVNRKGKSKNAFMICKQIIKHITKNTKYKITKDNLIKTQEEITDKHILNSKKPNNLLHFKGNIIDNISQNQTYNIFGKNIILQIDGNELVIPIIETNENNLSYFNVKLCKIGDVIEINTPNDIFLTKTSVGNKYIDDYLLQKNLGDGCYIEKHDNYHYHQPLNKDCKGYYLLSNQKNNIFEIGAFSIPYGYSILTPSFVWHADSFLIGDYLVAYGLTDNYTTCNIYDKKNDIVNILIKK